MCSITGLKNWKLGDTLQSGILKLMSGHVVSSSNLISGFNLFCKLCLISLLKIYGQNGNRMIDFTIENI